MRRALPIALTAAIAFLVGVAVASIPADDRAAVGDAPDDAVAAADPGTMSVTFDDEDLAASAVAPAVLDAADIESLVAEVDDMLLLEDDIEIVIREDPDEAYYDEGNGQIVISPSLIDTIADELSEVYETEEDALLAAASNLTFIVLHEVGHALVDAYELPITGSEEAAVDEFATLAIIELLDDPVVALETSDLFDWISDEPSEADFYDEHALDQQRFFQLRCVVYGLEPDDYADELDDLDISPERADLCIDDAMRAADSWETLLEPHMA